MTPKEKARELVNNYTSTIGIYNLDSIYSLWDISKQCALIAVDEIMNLCWNGNEVAKEYWQQVKKEIQQL